MDVYWMNHSSHRKSNGIYNDILLPYLRIPYYFSQTEKACEQKR